MATFAWRRRDTRHFGEQWVPFAEQFLKSTTGRWYPLSVQVDTGAVISVFPRSVCALLGADLESGERVELSGVGAQPRAYDLHKFPAKIGDLPEFPTRVAISEKEDVPSLLGRLDMMDRLQLDFDASLQETRVSNPWLNEQDQKIWQMLLDTEKQILSRWEQRPLPGRILRTLQRLGPRRSLDGKTAGHWQWRACTPVCLLGKSLYSHCECEKAYLIRRFI
jgi:hypothetical protein